MASTQGIKLDDDTKQRLKTLAEKRDRSPHYLMKTAISDYLEREETYEKEKAEDIARWEHFMHTGKSIDNTVMKKLFQDIKQGKRVTWPR
jgi:predicted transcriptional regulator